MAKTLTEEELTRLEGLMMAAASQKFTIRSVHPEVIRWVDNLTDAAPALLGMARECLEKRTKAAQADAEYARNYSPYSSRPCPFCSWDNGVRLEECGLHKEISTLRAKVGELGHHLSPKEMGPKGEGETDGTSGN